MKRYVFWGLGTAFFVVLVMIIVVFLQREGQKKSIDTLVFVPMQLEDGQSISTFFENNSLAMIGSVKTSKELMEVQSFSKMKLVGEQLPDTKLECVFINMRRMPCSDVTFREAMSCLVNRQYISQDLDGGMSLPCRNFISPLSETWTNHEALAYDFDTVKARELLDSSGYIYNELLKTRIDPLTQDGVTLTILSATREEEPLLWNIAYSLTYYLNAVGIKASHSALPTTLLFKRTRIIRDFDLYVGTLDIAPAPFALYPTLHSEQNEAGTIAYSGCNDGELDQQLEKLWTEIKQEEAMKASRDIQRRLVELIPFIPVCTTSNIGATSDSLAGVVSLPGEGISNVWSYISAKSALSHDEVLVQGVRQPIESLNPLTASNRQEWDVLKLIYAPLLYVDQKTLEPIPALAKSWDLSPWMTPEGEAGMVVQFSLNEGIFWQDGIPFTSDDIAYCIDTFRNETILADESTLSKIVDVKTPDSLTIEIYLNSQGYRMLYDLAWLTLFPKHIWENVEDKATFEPWLRINQENENLTQLIGQGAFIYQKSDVPNHVNLKKNSEFHWFDSEKAVE